MRAHLLRKVFLAVAFALAAAAGLAQEQGEWYLNRHIRDVAFTGLRNVRAADLDGIVNPFRGRPFDYSLFWELQGMLWALEYFDMIEPSLEPVGNDVLIRFAVTERPVIDRISFIGNSAVRRNALLDTISTGPRDVVNHVRIHLDEQAIVNLYLERGFPDVQVRSELQEIGGNTVLAFHITEGERVTIQEIRFEGNSTFSDRTLRGQLSLRTRGLGRDGAFSEARLVADRAALAVYYHERGFIDAVVLDVTQEIVRDARGNNNLILTFNISEGPRYTFAGVTFEGNRIFSDETLSALIRSRPGEVVNARRVLADLQRVADLYFENGYIFNTISTDERRDTVNNTVAYHILIIERGRAHIESISIVGNDRTRTDVVLREIPLIPGDVFSRTKVEEAWRNLMNLRFFSVVMPETPPGSAEGLMDLVFVVEEQPTTELQLGLTFTGSAEPDTFPISALVSVNDINFRGSGNQLGFNVNASPQAASGSLSYHQRWLFGLPLSGGFDFSVDWSRRLAAMNNSAPFFHGDESYAFPDGFASFDEFREAGRMPPREFLMGFHRTYVSLGFSTGYRWFTPAGNFSLGGGIRGGLVRIAYDDTVYRPFDPALRAGNNRWTPMMSVWTSVALDRRDLFFDPSRGYYLFGRVALHGLLPDEREHYMRSDTNAQVFIPLFNVPVTENWSFRMTLGLHTGVSFIFAQPGDRPLTVEDANRLALDGMFIARGWGSEFRNKGHALWNNWAELRMPLVPGLLAWDFFFDAAGVAGTEDSQESLSYFWGGNFGMENMRFSFGGGLRFTIPQFPFRLSLASRFRVVGDDVRWQAGSLFRGRNFDADTGRGGFPGLDPVLSIAVTF
ncbi:MAG: outer membrane protein assembly factor BamA [Treponema sp.]|nr:outer membrane protein assembly factor BamA [Treponema sp.]